METSDQNLIFYVVEILLSNFTNNYLFVWKRGSRRTPGNLLYAPVLVLGPLLHVLRLVIVWGRSGSLVPFLPGVIASSPPSRIISK